MRAVLLHGGCEERFKSDADSKRSEGFINEYGRYASELLTSGMDAIDIATTIICQLEDNPCFDAGTGSYLTMKREVEMDAIIMDSNSRIGSVISLKQIKNPILVARMVMEKTPHHILCGQGAYEFALSQGIPHFDMNSLGRDADDELVEDMNQYSELRERDDSFSTVGIIVYDGKTLVAATSTGGIKYKLPGRVGDSALPGAGTFCTERFAAIATGEGEGVIRSALTRETYHEYEKTRSAQLATQCMVDLASSQGYVCGIMTFSIDGTFGFSHNGKHMPTYIDIQKDESDED